MAAYPYNTAHWRKLRSLKLHSAPLCEGCEARGVTKAATVVDHRIAISQGGAAFPSLDGLASLCLPCHSRKTAQGPEAGAVKALRRGKGCNPDGTPIDPAHPWNGGNGRLSREAIDRRMPPDLGRAIIPLTIVCGPPASGKSTFVRDRAGPNDLVICLDTIMQELSGAPEHQVPQYWLPKALDRRNEILRSLATPSPYRAAFFIVGGESPRERELWANRLGGRVVVIDTPAAECIRRIRADAGRRGHANAMVEAVLAWWRANPHLVRKSLQPEPCGPPPNPHL